ncbi:hypothetical protein ACFO4P_16795 [Epilithonimonas pallida]|uniref:Uncharacterized protein n=1 Tax=Epilithonimonas pallida TaxID=373671 RepID=A0ABY1R6B6_9FLAO|nr:hypothetical protein [Epilithonimonas pallida]SMP94630.1 hypothetical protein SAMN05421679_10642 [Epilithonimonas pallida]
MKKTLTLILISFTTLACSQDLKFENPSFEKSVLEKYPDIDINKDGKISKNEAENLKELDLMERHLTNANDVKFFKNLEYLSLTKNKIEKLKLENFPYLTKFYCAKNNIKSLEVSNLPNLQELAFGVNQLDKVKINDCPNIESLNFMDNNMKEINLSHFKKLKYLSADHNKLKNLNLAENPELIQFIVNGNNIMEINITKNPKLNMNILYIDDNVKLIGTEEQMKNFSPAPSPPPPM